MSKVDKLKTVSKDDLQRLVSQGVELYKEEARLKDEKKALTSRVKLVIGVDSKHFNSLVKAIAKQDDNDEKIHELQVINEVKEQMLKNK